jgi:hypothetical protein
VSYDEVIKEQIEKLKEAVGPAFDKVARVCLAGNVLLYVACCVVANGPVGPVSYVAFLYHCCQWKVTHG